MTSPEEEDSDNIIRELGITPENPDDRDQLCKILRQHLNYPSDYLAKIHEKANRLGMYDEVNERRKLRQQYLKDGLTPDYCECCLCIKQPQGLSVFVPLEDIETAGESTLLFFLNMKYSAWMMFFTFLIYGAYALVTNIIASTGYAEGCITKKICQINILALGSKITNTTDLNNKLYLAQIWIGLCMVIFWILFFVYKAARERKLEIEEDDHTPTASDFTVMIENLPREVGRNELQSKLDEYANNEAVRAKIIFPSELYKERPYDGKFTIMTFNEARAYYEIVKNIEQQEPTKIQKEVEYRIQLMKYWINFRRIHGSFPNERTQRLVVYREYQDLQDKLARQRLKKLQSLQKLYKKQERSIETKTVFVTFNHSFARINLNDLNPTGWFSTWSICRKNQTRFTDYPKIKITRAPEPEDIVWENVGLRFGEWVIRKLVTYTITLIVLGCSFGIIYGLSVAQIESNSTALSFAISAFITVVNTFLGFSIRKLTWYEKDYRVTVYQTSLAIKTIVAQLINSILLSVLANYFIKTQNLYTAGGLAEDVFYFACSNAIIPPILKIIDFYYYFLRLRSWWYSFSPDRKMEFEYQVDYNKIWEGYEFEVGYGYVYIIKTVVYTAFFISLQPVISLIAPLGLFLMYWAEKYVLYKRCSRPKPSSDLINQSMNAMLYFSVIAYSLGSLTWTTFIPSNYPTYSLIPNLISLGLGILIYFVPIDQIMECVKGDEDVPLQYDQQRIFFVSEYDRLNPATKKEGLQNYSSYLKQKSFEKMNKQAIFNQFFGNNNKPIDNYLALTSQLVGVDINRSRSGMPPPSSGNDFPLGGGQSASGSVAAYFKPVPDNSYPANVSLKASSYFNKNQLSSNNLPPPSAEYINHMIPDNVVNNLGDSLLNMAVRQVQRQGRNEVHNLNESKFKPLSHLHYLSLFRGGEGEGGQEPSPSS